MGILANESDTEVDMGPHMFDMLPGLKDVGLLRRVTVCRYSAVIQVVSDM